VPQDLAQATSWYLRAAEQGHRYAQYNIAVMLFHGQGILQDRAAAFAWSAKAAAQGVPESEALLGDLYAAGLGTAPDRDSARRWYARAAAHGNAIASRRLRALEEGSRRGSTATDAAAASARDQQRRAGSIAIITMAYNERVNLPIWLRHYRRMAPTAALIVIEDVGDGMVDHVARPSPAWSRRPGYSGPPSGLSRQNRRPSSPAPRQGSCAPSAAW